MPIFPYKNILLLGFGQTAKALLNLLPKNIDVDWTSRKAFNPNSLSKIQFDMEAPSTWNNIQKNYDQTVLFFPTLNAEKLQQFLSTKEDNLGRLIVVTTTSIFEFSDGDRISEDHAWNPHHNRFESLTILKNHGANLLYASGIYSSLKHPAHWLSKGLIKGSLDQVNLIHVDDLAGIILKLLNAPENPRHYIASDGTAYLWQDIENHFFNREPVNSQQKLPKTKTKPSKILSNQRLLEDLEYSFKHPDLFKVPFKSN